MVKTATRACVRTAKVRIRMFVRHRYIAVIAMLVGCEAVALCTGWLRGCYSLRGETTGNSVLPVKRPGARFPTYPVQASWVRFVCRLLNERQPCGIKKSQAYRLIEAMKLRPFVRFSTKTSHQPIRVAVRGKNQMLHRRVLYPFWIANACFPGFSARVEVRESQENQ